MFTDLLKRKTVVTGHYGSGKTEFSVSLAMLIAGLPELQNAKPCSPVALIDLDVVNPYFRSREQRELLAAAGITVYGSAYEADVTAEIPELGASVRVPLESPDTLVIADLGGNDSGALIINQFIKYFTDDDTMTAAVINANRPGTGTVRGALRHITAIEEATGLTVSHIINNTHLLRETTAHDIEKGHALCLEYCNESGKRLLCDCYPKEIVSPGALAGLSDNLMPLGLYMRPGWLDK